MRPLANHRRLALVVVAIVAGAIASGCYSSTSTSGPQAAAEIFLGGTKVSGAAAPTLTVTPGATATVDLRQTILKGKIGPKSGSGSKNNAKVLSKCIAKVEWSLLKADGTPLGADHAGTKTWSIDKGNSVDECASGATDRTIDVPMPADVTGLSLSLAVFSAICRDRACSQPAGRRGVRGMAPSERRDSQRWITGQVAVKLVAAQASGLYFSYMPSSGPYTGIGRSALDGTGVNLSLVTAAADVNSVAVRGEYLYWATDTTIGRAKLDGTEVDNAFLTGLGAGGITPDIADIAVTDQYIFWINNAGGSSRIGRADVEGTGVNPSLVTSGSVLSYLAANVTHVYYASASFAVFKRVTAIGTGEENMPYLNAGTLGDFAIDRTHLYYSGVGFNAIGRMPVDGASNAATFIDRSADGFLAYRGVAVDATHIYWVAERSSDSASFISRANLDGTGVVDTWLPISQTLNGLAVAPAAAARSGSPTSRQATTSYTGASTVRLSKTITIKPAQQVGYEVKNEILRGRYTLATPRKGRPAGLAAFTAGDYVQKIDVIRLTPNATGSETTVTGTGTMLLRGKKNALLCTTIDSTAVATTYTFAGGKGAGATVTGGMTSAPLDFKGTWERASGLKVVKGVQVQTKPITEKGTVAAATGAKRALPAACKALVKHLPKAKKATKR